MVSALDSEESGWSGFGSWPGTLCYLLGQDTLYPGV